jgi:hypothetical protein
VVCNQPSTGLRFCDDDVMPGGGTDTNSPRAEQEHRHEIIVTSNDDVTISDGTLTGIW